MKKFMLNFLLFFMFSFMAYSQTAPDRVKGWRSDIDSLLVFMKREHYVYNKQPLPGKLITNSKILKSTIKHYSDERMLIEMERLMYYMQDGHSYILPFFAKKVTTFYLPVQFYLFKDGVYIVDAVEPYRNSIGYRITHINNITPEKLVKDMTGYIHQDNKFTVQWFAPTILRLRGVHEAYGLTAGAKDITLKLLDHNSQPQVKQVAFVEATDFRGIPKLIPSQLNGANEVPMYLKELQSNFWVKPLPVKEALYFQFNQVRDMKSESIAAFSKRLDSILSAINPKLFIIDVRHNNGGNKNLLPPLIDVIKKYNAVQPLAKIVVITGRNTFSAAQVFISLLDKEMKVLFAGEPSSSKPNFVGEENRIVLPWSGAVGSISNRYHENIPSDKRKWIKPDFSIPLYSKQYFNNQDPVIGFLLNKF